MARLRILGMWALTTCVLAASGCGSKKHRAGDTAGSGGAHASGGRSSGGLPSTAGDATQAGDSTTAGAAGDSASPASGGAALGEGGAVAMATAGADTMNILGGNSSTGGTTAAVNDTGGTDSGAVSAGGTSAGGSGAAGGAESGGTLGSGGTNSGGTSASSGGVVLTPQAGNAAAGEAGESGQSGSDSAGAGGVGQPGSACGDGVFVEGVACCTSDWVQAEIQAFTATIAQSSTGSQSCIAKTQSGLASACNTAVCAEGAVGCKTLIRRSEIDYDPATQTIAGSSDIEVTGHVSSFVGSCNFLLTLNDTRYTADVITQITAQSLQIGIDDVKFDYDPRVTGCESVPGANSLIESYVSSVVEPTLRQQLITTVRTTVPCPY